MRLRHRRRAATRAILIVLAAATATLAQPAAAQWVAANGAETDVAAAPEDVLARHRRVGAPGGAVAVARDGEIVFAGAFGDANLEHGVAATVDTPFNAASVSKQFTAFAIATLAEDGRLSLDDDIRTHLPETPTFEHPVTIRHLLHHTSGLRDEYGLLALGGWRPGDVMSNDDVLAMVSRLTTLDQTPGDHHVYSNTNYTLLAIIVERVTGDTFSDWTHTNIFDPLAMTHTRFIDSPGVVMAGRATGYGYEDGAYVRRPRGGHNVGPGGLYTSARDLAAWADNLMSGRVGGDAVMRRMRERGVLNDGSEIDYAFGLAHGFDHGLPTLGHGGSGPAAQSSLTIYPDQRFAVVALSNSDGHEVALSEITRPIVEHFVGDSFVDAPAASGAPRMLMITDDDLAASPQGSFAADTARFDAYAGTYTLERNAEFEGDIIFGAKHVIVSRDQDRLLIAFGQPPGFPLAPVGPDRFIMPQMAFEVSFRDGGDEKVKELVVHLTDDTFGHDGPPTDVRAVKSDTSDVDLAAYAGAYYSAELDTIYRFAVDDGRLVAVHQRHGDVPLDLLARDEFLADTRIFTNVSFLRDARGAVTQVRLKGYSWSSSAVLDRIDLP